MLRSVVVRMLVPDSAVFRYIPHRSPMILVSSLLECTSEKGISTYLFKGDSPFLEKGYMSEAGLYENMAQTEALRSGYLKKEANSKRILYVGSITDGVIYAWPKMGERIKTVTKVEHEFPSASVISAQVFLSDDLIAEAKLKLFVPEDA